MLQARTVRPAELDRTELSAWRAFREAEPAFASPLLSPEFAQAVGSVRRDAAVAVFRQGGEIAGFLPHHRRAGGIARPIGAPFSDYQALIAAPEAEIDLGEALGAAGLRALRFSSLVDPVGRFAAIAEAQEPAYRIRLDGDADAYRERLRAASAKKFKNWRRLEHKAERELGALVLSADVSPLSFERVLGWKREQLRRTGRHDFLRAPWTGRLLRSLADRRDRRFSGLLLTLRAGERVVAGHFGLRAGDWFHPWIASRDPDLPEFSLGQSFLWRAIGAMPALGLSVYDLGPGHDHYKRPFALEQVSVSRGLAAAACPAGRRAASVERALALAERAAQAGGVAAFARARRRLAHIADVETSFGGWARGVADAFVRRPRALAAEGFD